MAVDGRATAIRKAHVVELALDGGVDEIEAAPVAARGRFLRKNHALRVGAVRHDFARAVDRDRHARSHINRRARANGQRDAGRHDEVGGDAIRPGRRRPGGVRDRAAGGDDARVVIPNVIRQPLGLDRNGAPVERLNEHFVDAGVERHVVRRPHRLPRAPRRGHAVDFHRARRDRIGNADEIRRRRGRVRIATRHRRAGRHRDVQRDERGEVRAARRLESLDAVDLRLRRDAGEDFIHERVEIRRRERPFEQFIQMLVVERREGRKLHKGIHHHRRPVGGGIILVDHPVKPVLRRRRHVVALAADRVEIVGHELRAGIDLAHVEVEIVAVAVRDIRLRIVHDRLRGEEAHPFVHVHFGLHRGLVIGIVGRAEIRRGMAFRERLRECDEVGPVVCARVGVLEPDRAVGIGRLLGAIRREISQIALRHRVRRHGEIVTLRAVEIARVVKREMMFHKIAVLHLITHVKAEARGARVNRVRRIPAHLDLTRLRPGQPRLAEQRAAEKLRVRVLRIEVE